MSIAVFSPHKIEGTTGCVLGGACDHIKVPPSALYPVPQTKPALVPKACWADMPYARWVVPYCHIMYGFY